MLRFGALLFCTFSVLLSISWSAKPRSAEGGCSITIGELKVLGNYEYDSLNNLYRFKLGDTLKVYYTGHGGTYPYYEEYYYNGIYIGSTRIDTIKVGEDCTVKVVYGCDNSSFEESQILHFANNLQTGQATQKQEESGFKTYYNSNTGNLHFSLASEFPERFDVLVYSSTGQKLQEFVNISSGEAQAHPLNYSGVVIVQCKRQNKQSSFTRLLL